MTCMCVEPQGVVTEEMRLAAEAKRDELFDQLITAKNEWQYAVQNEEAAYQKVLRIKAEYAEWRALTERLTDILAGRAVDKTVTAPEPASPAAHDRVRSGTTRLLARFSSRRSARRG